jgi:acyl-CoA synthetase (AMP-forming)/AMP-acid ligase II
MIRHLGDILAIERTPMDISSVANTRELIARTAARQPDAPALSFFARVDDHETPVRWSYAALLADIDRAARLFRRLGVARSDVVAYILPNLPETHVVIWGAETAGIVFAVNPALEGRHITELLKAANARWVVTTTPESDPETWRRVESALTGLATVMGVLMIDAARHVPGHETPPLPTTAAGLPVLDFCAELARENAQAPDFPLPAAHDIASYFCTGGTTGLPKIARRSHGNEIANVLQLSVLLGDAFLKPGSVVLTALPLFHVNAVIGTGLAVFAQGSHLLLAPPAGFRAPGLIPRFWEVIEQHRVAGFSGVPTVFAGLLQVPRAGRDISSLSHAICGAAPMPPELFRAVERETGMHLLEGYGLTESTCMASIMPPDGERRIGAIGLRAPWQHMRAAIVDSTGQFVRFAAVDEVGAVCLSGPNMFLGYLSEDHNRDVWFEAPNEAGQTCRWFNTGDLGRMDADGYFWLAGRKKELIIRGGHNIDPREIEEALASHPAVAMCAAVGRPDMHAGEVPVAYVQLRQGASASEADLLAHAAARISERAVVPKAIIIVSALPLTAVGKTFKPALNLLEVEGVVRGAATACGVELAALLVEQDPKLGIVARYQPAQKNAASDALAAALGRYIFRSETIAG